MFRSSEKVQVFKQSLEISQSSLNDLLEKTKISSPFITSKYCYVNPPNCNKAAKFDLYKIYESFCIDLDHFLKKDSNFHILKRHQDKLPKDVYYQPAVSVIIDIEINQICFVYSLWKTDVKLAIDRDLPEPVLEQLQVCLKEMCAEVLERVKSSGEIDGESNEVLKRGKLIRQVIKDLNQEGTFKMFASGDKLQIIN